MSADLTSGVGAQHVLLHIDDYAFLSWCATSHARKGAVARLSMLVPQVRDYEFDEEMQSNQSEASQVLKSNADKKRKQLEEWSASAYGEVRNLLEMLWSSDYRLNEANV